MGSNILPMCKGDNYKFHAAGREDIDVMRISFINCLHSFSAYCADPQNCLFQVRMLGSGRPFLVEIQNARQIPSEAIVKEIEARINGLENKLVSLVSSYLENACIGIKLLKLAA